MKSDSPGKGKKDEREKGKKSKRIRYTPGENAAYKAKMAAKEAKEKVAPKDIKVEHTNLMDAHKGIPETEIEKRKQTEGCTRCSLPGHQWKYSNDPRIR